MAELRIRELLRERNMTMAALAERIGVTQANISILISGKSQPRTDTLEKIAKAMGVELWELFTPSTDKGDFVAMVKRGDRFFYANSLSELKKVVKTIEGLESGETD